eukprot:scaffold312192_cov56-Attheya_sp.AAC.1
MGLGENAANAILELILKKLLPLEHMWARHHRLFLFAFDEKATSFVESLNRVIKCGRVPVHANSSLEWSCSGMINSTNERMGEKLRCSAREERSTPLFSRSHTRHHLIAPGESMLINHFEKRINFRVVQSKNVSAMFLNHYGTNTKLGKKLVEIQLKSRTHPGCLLTSPLNCAEHFNYPLFLRGATSDEFQRATKILERAKGNNPIAYHGSLEKSMEESDCDLEPFSVIPEVLAGMLEPTSKTSKQTSLLHEMLEKQVDIVNATKFPDQIELYKEMDNNVREIIKCATDPCDVNFVRENYLYVIKTLKEHRASEVIANDPNRSKKRLLSSYFETDKTACHKRLKESHDYATKK